MKHKRQVLIVDDIKTNRLLLTNMLQKDYDVLEAEDGAKALAVLSREEIIVSAVLLDISMPGMNGYEVLTHIREDRQLAATPVIMITGSEDEASRVKSLALGANDYVMKPYNSDVIKHCLKNNIAFHEASETVSALQRDKLTGLFTRETFFDKVRTMVAEHEPGYYVMSCIDVDNFKVLNDQYGVETGDDVLVCLANNLKRDCDTDGSICGRIAADNFAVLYETRFLEERTVNQHDHVKAIMADSRVSFVISIGRYIINDKSLSVSAMYDRALLARKTIKGRADVHVALFDETMRSSVIREQEIVSEMHSALKDRQFEVWFQPQYNHATGAMIGAEALVRWRHPQKGLVPPCDFIPVFEKNGFIYDLDKFVWEEVCRFLRRWLDEGRTPPPVSVNISRYDVLRPDLTEVISGLTDKYNLPLDLFRLEITESAFSESAQRIVSVVRELIHLGFTVEIDDFGSGYSSLNTLKDVPAQILKLDMKFFDSSDDSQRGGNIVESVVRMAKWLGMSVIAEGVETIEQADYLKSIGCNYIQGYLYARPMPTNQYETHCKGIVREERLLALETVENMDNNAFWDPDSMDSLIFNSYVGAACIFEYKNEKIEVIRSTEKFAKMISSASMSVEDTLKLDWSAHLDSENKETLRHAIEESKRTSADVTVEFLFYSLPGCTEKTYVRATMRVIATAGSRYLVYNLVENITERREAQQKMREAVAQMQMMMDDTPGGFVRMRLNSDGKLSTEYVNETYCRMRNMTAEEIIGAETENALLAIHPDDAESVLAIMQQVLATGEKRHTVYRVLRADGSYIHLNAYGSITNNESGQTFVNIFYTELSEQEKRDLTIREMMPFVLSAIMQSSSDLAFAKDKDFNYICCSPGFVKFTRQKTEADVIGKTDYDFWTKEVADRFRADDLRLFESGESLIDFTEPIPSDDGVQHYSVTSKYILRDSTGEIIGLYGLGRDVTDTRNALDRLRLLTDSIPGGIACYTLTKDSIDMTYFNDGLCKMMGTTREKYGKVVKESATARVYPEDLPKLMENVRALYENGTPMDCTYRNFRVEGEGTVWINIKATVSERREDMAIVNAVLYDVTSQHEAEQKQKETAQRMQTITDSAGTGIRAMTIDGNREEYLFSNDRFYELQGYTREQYEAEVSDPYGVVHPDDYKRVKNELRTIADIGDIKKLEFRIITRGGEICWIRAVISVTSFDGVKNPVQLCIYTDVTEIIEANKRETEAQRALLDNMPYGAALYEYDGKKLTAVHLNKKYWELVERQPDEENKLPFINAVHPDDRALIASEVSAAIKQKRAININLRIRCGVTGYKPFHITANTESTDNGAYLIYAAYEAINEDVLSYQQALPLLLSAVMNSTNDFAFAKDKEFRYLSVSRAFIRLAGLNDESDALGKTDYELFPRDMAEQFRQNDIALLESGKSLVDYDETVYDPDGTTHYCRASKYPLRDASGQLIGLYGVSRDITKERGAFEQLKLVNDTVPGGIATYSVQNGNLSITYCNDGFCELFDGTIAGFRKRGRLDPMDWVAEEDRNGLQKQIDALVNENKPVDHVYRICTVTGQIKWINHKATVAERHGDTVVFNSLLLDITERQSFTELLRISEEENALAVKHSGNVVCRYNVAEKTLAMSEESAQAHHIPPVLSDVPAAPVRLGLISSETADAYTGFFEAIQKGDRAGTVLFQQKYMGDWHWEEARSSTVFADDGTPVKAVISMSDVTDRIEKENIYKKWRQSLTERAPESYTLFRCNLNRNFSYESKEGTLFGFDFDASEGSFNERTRSYAVKCVHEQDRDRYIAFVNADTMLASYYRGVRSDVLEYRELTDDSGYRWLRLTVDLVEYPNTTDVEAYMMYEDIDETKKTELQTKELSENDSLTGLLNRAAFTARVNDILSASKPETKRALMMLDVDGFKQVNDVFGHGAGDAALIDIAAKLRSVTRADDFVARLGGDEFVVFLSNIPNTNPVTEKAKQIRSLCRKAFSMEVQISVSIGIAFSPSDGTDFDTLYKKADSALYYVKGSGRDNQAIYSENMADEHLKPEPDYDDSGKKIAEKKRRMLIVDDNSIDHAVLRNIFRDEFILEEAKDGNSALIRLRHYGSAISVVLLDLMMPGMDGFAVLGKMQESAELRSIPVIMVSGDESRETCLTAIRKGATDFVTKPVDVDVLRIRVHSAVSKAENERLRAKNSLLKFQSSEVRRYKTALECSGIAVIENDLITDSFIYDRTVGEHLTGEYNDRKFWDILLSDKVTDEQTVARMREFVQKTVSGIETNAGSIIVALKTLSGEFHRFKLSVNKGTNESGVTDKLYLMLAKQND